MQLQLSFFWSEYAAFNNSPFQTGTAGGGTPLPQQSSKWPAQETSGPRMVNSPSARAHLFRIKPSRGRGETDRRLDRAHVARAPSMPADHMPERSSRGATASPRPGGTADADSSRTRASGGHHGWRGQIQSNPTRLDRSACERS